LSDIRFALEKGMHSSERKLSAGGENCGKNRGVRAIGGRRGGGTKWVKGSVQGRRVRKRGAGKQTPRRDQDCMVTGASASSARLQPDSGIGNCVREKGIERAL